MAIDIGMHTGPQEISMQELRRIWQRADESGFRWISVWDHFYANPLKDRNDPCFEGVAAMAALAALTQRVQVGFAVLTVAAVSTRHPRQQAQGLVMPDHLGRDAGQVRHGADADGPGDAGHGVQAATA